MLIADSFQARWLEVARRYSILPTDLMVKKKGIHLASRCVCCACPSEESLLHVFIEESLLHVFIESDLASSLWKFFGIIFAVRFTQQEIYHRLAWWFLSCRGNSHFAIPGRMTTIAICRQIWSFHNNIIYGGMSKPLSHSHLVAIDALQFVDHILSSRPFDHPNLVVTLCVCLGLSREAQPQTNSVERLRTPGRG